MELRQRYRQLTPEQRQVLRERRCSDRRCVAARAAAANRARSSRAQSCLTAWTSSATFAWPSPYSIRV